MEVRHRFDALRELTRHCKVERMEVRHRFDALRELTRHIQGGTKRRSGIDLMP